MNFEHLKVGDKVVVHSGGVMSYREVREIAGETPTQWKVGAYRFWKKTGNCVGSLRRSLSLPSTPEELEKVAKMNEEQQPQPTV